MTKRHNYPSNRLGKMKTCGFIGDNYVIFDKNYRGIKIIDKEILNFNFFDYPLKELKKRAKILANPNVKMVCMTKTGPKTYGRIMRKK
jgi:hypothetical protein